MSVRRFDRGTIRFDKARTPQGFLRADATIARTGVQLYRRADGSTRREYRPDSEVFDPAALASFEAAPLTLNHPPEMVTSQNIGKYGRGYVTGPSKHADGRRVAASILVTHADAINAAESGTVQLSGGYECDMDETPGVSPEGERYDTVQRKIRGNHVALLNHGRAGPDVCLKMDALDAELVEDDEQPIPSEELQMKTTIRGLTFDIADQAAQALELERGEAAQALKLAQDAAATNKGEADKQRARADVAEAARDVADKARKDADDPKRYDLAVSARAELLGRVRAVMGRDHKTDGKDALALKREVVTKLAPEIKLDGKSEIYVEAIFDHAIVAFEKKNPAAAALAGVIDPPRPGVADEDDLDPRVKMMRDQDKTSREMGRE